MRSQTRPLYKRDCARPHGQKNNKITALCHTTVLCTYQKTTGIQFWKRNDGGIKNTREIHPFSTFHSVRKLPGEGLAPEISFKTAFAKYEGQTMRRPPTGSGGGGAMGRTHPSKQQVQLVLYCSIHNAISYLL